MCRATALFQLSLSSGFSLYEEHVDAWKATTSGSNCLVNRTLVEQEEDETIGARLSLLHVHHTIPSTWASRRFNPEALDAGSREATLTQVQPYAAVASPVRQRLQKAMPLAWTHVPKCGTSFVNSLVRLPGVCPELSVGDRVYGPPEEGYTWFSTTFPDWPTSCPGLKRLDDQKRSMLELHVMVGSMFDDLYDDHGVIMLRQPEQRVISMYNHATRPLHDGSPKRDPVHDSAGSLIQKYNMRIAEFAKATAGCAVRMLTKDPVSDLAAANCMGVDADLKFVPSLTVSNADVAEARRRLRHYAFVGITEDWSLSLCLLHTMFGGDCHTAEFANVRNHSSSADGYDTSVLQGFVDQHDGALYEEALSVFAAKLRLYGVSHKTCQRCFQSAGLEVASVPPL